MLRSCSFLNWNNNNFDYNVDIIFLTENVQNQLFDYLIYLHVRCIKHKNIDINLLSNTWLKISILPNSFSKKSWWVSFVEYKVQTNLHDRIYSGYEIREVLLMSVTSVSNLSTKYWHLLAASINHVKQQKHRLNMWPYTSGCIKHVSLNKITYFTGRRLSTIQFMRAV